METAQIGLMMPRPAESLLIDGLMIVSTSGRSFAFTLWKTGLAPRSENDDTVAAGSTSISPIC
jgi:hypothetical protein